MDPGEDDRPGARVASAEIVKEFLAEVVAGVDVENEEIRFGFADHALRFREIGGNVDLRVRCSRIQRADDFRRKLRVGLQDEDAPVGLGSRGMAGRGLVHGKRIYAGKFFLCEEE